MALLKRKPADMPLTVERQFLAQRIAMLAEAKSDEEALVRATQKLSDDVLAAQARVDAAEEAVTTASADAVRYLTETARGKSGPAPMTSREARDALQDAQEHAASCREARDALRAGHSKLQSRVDLCLMYVRDAAKAVIVAEAVETATVLAARVDRLQRELFDSASALAFLVSIQVLPGQVSGYFPFCHPEAEPARSAVRRFPTPWAEWNDLANPDDKTRGDPAWRAAFDGLTRDASTTLPAAD